jgi:hypothetical protein
MHKVDHLTGITPIVLRRAGYYLALGVGEYFPKHPHYDKVVVETLYDITPNPLNDTEWSQGMTVSFYKNNRRIRWIDFGCRVTGAGGDQIMKEVISNE